MTACGAAVAGKFIVRITPDWKEPLVIQVLLVMFSGERKTAALAEILAPIEAYERELAEASRGEIARQKGQKEILEQRLHSAQGAAAKAKGPIEKPQRKRRQRWRRTWQTLKSRLRRG